MKQKLHLYAAFLTALFLMYFSIICDAQQKYRLSGVVKSRENATRPTPVANMSIIIKDTRLGTLTNRRGSFSLILTEKQLQNEIVFSHVGYSALQLKIKKEPDWTENVNNFILNFKLEKIFDSDGDNVMDNADKCPDLAGPESNNGCPLSESVKMTWSFENKNIRMKETDHAVDLSLNKTFKRELIAAAKIIPTKESIKLIEAFNPKLKGKAIEKGEEIVMPPLPNTKPERAIALQAVFERSYTHDETGLKDLLAGSKIYERLTKTHPLPEPHTLYNKDLAIISNLLRNVANNQGTMYRKYETDRLNSELKEFNDYYSMYAGASQLEKFDTTYIREFHAIVSTIITPHLFKRIPVAVERLTIHGPHYNIEYGNEPNYSSEFFYEDSLPYIFANIYVFTPDRRVPDDSFYIYVISSRQFRRLLNKEINLSYLESLKLKSDYLASVTAVNLNPSFGNYVILAEHVNQRGWYMTFSEVDASIIPEHSGKAEMTKPYAVPLYIEKYE